MPQTWDEKGNLIQPAPQVPPSMPTAKQKQVWDEKGKPVQAAPPPAVPQIPTPKQPQLGVTQGTPQSLTSAAPSSIGPREPSYWERQKARFTEGAPTGSLLGRQSSAVNQPGDKPISLIKFEAGMTPKEREKHPVITGIQEILSSLTTPENLALVAGSGGMGELPGLAKATIPRLVSLYFTGQMLYGAYKEIPEFKQALDTGNDSEAKRIMTHIAGGTALAGLASRHAIKGEPPSTAPDSLLNSGVDIIKKRATVAAASHEALKVGVDKFKNTIGDSYKTAKDQGVAKLAQNIVKADQLDSQSKGLAGSTHAGNIDKVIDIIVKDKGAGKDYNSATVELPGTKIIKDAIKLKVAKKGPMLSWDDLKDINQAAEFAKQAAYGKDAAIVGDFTGKLRNVMRGRAAQLGPDRLADHDEYVQTMKDLSTHKDGILSKLNSADTPLKFVNELSKESNRPDLDRLFRTLEKHGGLPSNYMDDFLKSHKFITHFANATEGDSKVAKLANRAIAMKTHKVAGTSGLMAGAVIGRIIGGGLGSPMMGAFTGGAFGAAFMMDLMDKYNAAQQIREIGGPSGVTGNPITPAQQATPPSAQTPPGGPGLPPAPPPIQTPPPVAPSGLSPALTKLLPSKIKITTDSLGVKWAEGPGGVRVSIPKGILEPKIMKYAEGKIEEQAKAQSEIKAKAAPEVTKVPSEARGREPSARKGMTKDTPEARRAKAAERIAKKRAEASRTQIKSTLEDQARQVAGRMDFQGKSNLELEEGLKELFGDNGSRFLKQFQSLAKQQKWSDAVYRGYLEDTLDRRAKELASRPNVPGLGTEPKKN